MRVLFTTIAFTTIAGNRSALQRDGIDRGDCMGWKLAAQSGLFG
jgi:hypothetical protein